MFQPSGVSLRCLHVNTRASRSTYVTVLQPPEFGCGTYTSRTNVASRSSSHKLIGFPSTNHFSSLPHLNRRLQVICRIRPPTADEKASGVPMALEALGEGEVGVKTSGRHGGGGGGASSWRSFTLDKALGPSTTQEEVFRQVRVGLRRSCASRAAFFFF